MGNIKDAIEELQRQEKRDELAKQDLQEKMTNLKEELLKLKSELEELHECEREENDKEKKTLEAKIRGTKIKIEMVETQKRGTERYLAWLTTDLHFVNLYRARKKEIEAIKNFFP